MKKNKKNRLEQIIEKNVTLMEQLLNELTQIDNDRNQYAQIRVRHK